MVLLRSELLCALLAMCTPPSLLHTIVLAVAVLLFVFKSMP